MTAPTKSDTVFHDIKQMDVYLIAMRQIYTRYIPSQLHLNTQQLP